jgi:hypothetical protein
MGPGRRLILAVLAALSIVLAVFGVVIAMAFFWGSGSGTVVASSIVLLGVGFFAALVAFKWVQGDRAWFSNYGMTAAEAIENELTVTGAAESEDWREEVAEGQIGVPVPCWRCGGLAPAAATECPSCGASLE